MKHVGKVILEDMNKFHGFLTSSVIPLICRSGAAIGRHDPTSMWTQKNYGKQAIINVNPVLKEMEGGLEDPFSI
jgi:hypothetical protein